MTRTEHLLTILAEECAEVAQRASKAARFGLAEVQPGQDQTNAQRLIDEVNDLCAVYQMLAGPLVSPTEPLFRGDVNAWAEAVAEKQRKVERFLRYSAECGTLS
jgi:NTP pyrophosphatase (non-canonical NTP hydrolase)